jgi:Beta-propeller repeat
MRSALLLFVCVGAFAASPQKIPTAPIQFEQSANHQWTARGLGYAFRFESTGAAMRLGDSTLRMTFENSNPSAPYIGLNHSAHPTNSFRGKTYQRFENYTRLRRTGIYPGVDLVYYSRNGELEYDFEIAPGADPSPIALSFEGADSIRLNDHGDLVLALGPKELTERAPSVYQRRASGELVSVQGSYQIGDDHKVRFHLGDYDRSAQLIVDPSVVYVAFLSGSSGDVGISVGHDPQGYIYVGGYTYSGDFPLGGDSYHDSLYGEADCFIIKLDPYATDATQVIVYSTYFGGVTGNDFLTAMKVDQAGIAYFTGNTDSNDFPVSGAAYSSTLTNLTHAFMTALDTTQDSIYSEIYSTYYGGTTGNESGNGIFQLNGFIYITGFTNSTDLPTVGAFQGSLAGSDDAFVAKFDPTQQGSAGLIFASYLGGGAQDWGRDIAADSNGLIYVTGYTFSGDMPYTSTAYESYAGGGDAYLAVINPNTSSVVYCTSFGGSSGYEEGKKLLVDLDGKHVAVAGYTMSSDFPVTQNAYQSVMPAGGNLDPFGNLAGSNGFLMLFDMTVLAPLKGVVYSTYLGGYGGEVLYDLKRDSQGYYYLCGYTLSRNFPVTNSAINTASAGGGLDGFVTVLNPDAKAPASQLVYSSYITSPGTQTVFGVDIDIHGTVWITGMATGSIFPPGFETFPVSPSTGNPQPGKQASFLWGFTIQ